MTGRPSINQLLREELFEPYDLDDTRVEYAQSSLPPNSERAVRYDCSSGDPDAYYDTSWKVLGAGEGGALVLHRRLLVRTHRSRRQAARRGLRVV